MTILFVIGVLVFLAFIVEATHFMVFGWFIPEEELGVYLEKYLPNAQLNEFSKDGTLFSGFPRYVARTRTFITKWYISDYGTIPRWSKWSKKLDDRRKELLPVVPPKKKLSEL